jgi:hypothetical protein
MEIGLVKSWPRGTVTEEKLPIMGYVLTGSVRPIVSMFQAVLAIANVQLR